MTIISGVTEKIISHLIITPHFSAARHGKKMQSQDSTIYTILPDSNLISTGITRKYVRIFTQCSASGWIKAFQACDLIRWQLIPKSRDFPIWHLNNRKILLNNTPWGLIFIDTFRKWTGKFCPGMMWPPRVKFLASRWIVRRSFLIAADMSWIWRLCLTSFVSIATAMNAGVTSRGRSLSSARSSAKWMSRSESMAGTRSS